MSSQSSGIQLHSVRRKMRKGTASCVECRRRKVRCIIRPNAQACQACILHNLPCTDQEFGISKAEVAEKRSNVQKKKTELGSLIEAMLQKLPSDGSKLELKAIEALRKLQSEIPPPKEDEFTMSQNDATKSAPDRQENEPWTRLDGFEKIRRSDIGSSSEFNRKSDLQECPTICSGSAKVVNAMKAAAPNPYELTLLIEAGQSVWKVWEISFPEVRSQDHDRSANFSVEKLQSYISGILDSNNAVGIAKVLLCSALCVQQLPSTIDTTKTCLPFTSDALQKQWLTPVEELLSQDETSACTIDGLHCMILQTRIYIILGLPYRAWFVFRRAIGYAHLQKLDQQPFHSVDSISRRKGRLWQQLWTGERFLALLMGLPCSTNIASHGEIPGRNDGSSQDLLSALGIVAGNIIDRDQRQAAIDFSETMVIEEDLQKCRDLMAEEWWNTIPGSDMSLAAIADMFIAKSTYHNIRRQLHLPLMLRAVEYPEYQFNRETALQSSREMIKLYRIMRDANRPVLTVCNLADFQVFLAALVIVLDLLNWSSQLDTWLRSGQLRSDWELVTRVIEDLKRVSKDFPSGVATQAVKTLEDLYNMQFSTSYDKDKIYETIVPYFGKITIKAISKSPSSALELVSNSTTSATSITEEVYEQTFVFNSHLMMPEHSNPSPILPLADCSATLDFDLSDDWSLFLNADDFS